MTAMHPGHKYYPKTLTAKLGYVVEECGEVQAAIGKTLRWGLDSYNPKLPVEQRETNRDWILRELRAAMFILEAELLSGDEAEVP